MSSLFKVSRILRAKSRFSQSQIQPWISYTRPCRTLLTERRRYATAAPKPAFSKSSLLSTPVVEYLEDEEIDAEIPPLEEISLNVTDRAAEQLKKVSEKQANPDAALRVLVESGGCHGYQYKVELATQRQSDDYHFCHPTIQPSNILVDAVSFNLVNGSTIDFATELIGSSFRVDDNPQSKGNGCGCGVSWELKS